MRKLATLVLVSSFGLVGCNLRNSDDQSITIKKDDFKYQFTAEFPERKTKRVFMYIEETLSKKGLINLGNEYDNKEVNLGDSIRFQLSAEPGYVKITFLKSDNSTQGAIKLEQMCAGIKENLR